MPQLISWSDPNIIVEFFKLGITVWFAVFLAHRVWSLFRSYITSG